MPSSCPRINRNSELQTEKQSTFLEYFPISFLTDDLQNYHNLQLQQLHSQDHQVSSFWKDVWFHWSNLRIETQGGVPSPYHGCLQDSSKTSVGCPSIFTPQPLWSLTPSPTPHPVTVVACSLSWPSTQFTLFFNSVASAPLLSSHTYSSREALSTVPSPASC